MNSGIANRIQEICINKEIAIETLEEAANIESGTIKKWNFEEPNIYDYLNVCRCLDEHPYKILSGQKLNKLSRIEEEMIFLFRNSDTRGKRTIRAIIENQFDETLKNNSVRQNRR